MTRTDKIIHQVDKGGAVVVLNTEDYRLEALRQLNNISTYRPLDSDRTDSIQRGLLQLLDDGREMGVLEWRIIDFFFFFIYRQTCAQTIPCLGTPNNSGYSIPITKTQRMG